MTTIGLCGVFVSSLVAPVGLGRVLVGGLAMTIGLRLICSRRLVTAVLLRLVFRRVALRCRLLPIVLRRLVLVGDAAVLRLAVGSLLHGVMLAAMAFNHRMLLAAALLVGSRRLAFAR